MPVDSASPVVTAGPIDISGQRIFVTGGTGFLGRTLLDYIAESVVVYGEAVEVWVLSRDPGGFLDRHVDYARHRWLRWIRGDVRTLTPANAPRGARFTSVVHAAADTHAVCAPLDWIDQIVQGTRLALDFAHATGARRFLNLSSGAVYGRANLDIGGIPESCDTAPPTESISSVYGQAKRLAEQICTVHRLSSGLETVNARCFALLGRHLPLDGSYAASNFIRDALTRNEVTVRGSGTVVRSYLHGRDAAHWLMTLMLRGIPGESYNVGSDLAVTVAELARRIVDVLSPGKPVVFVRGDAEEARTVYVPSIAKARRLGLRVETPLDDAIAQAGRR